MMQTLNTRQLRALAIVAPGTLALSGTTIGGAPFFLVAHDDMVRSGIWGIAAYSDGDVGLYTGDQRSTEAQPNVVEYDYLVRKDAEARLEAEAERRFDPAEFCGSCGEQGHVSPECLSLPNLSAMYA